MSKKNPITGISPIFSTKKIAITGTSGAGKTAFLVALLNHLQSHDPKLFDMGGEKKRFMNFEPSKRRSHFFSYGTRDWDIFPYETIRTQMARGSWPVKTTAESQFAVQLSMSHWWGYAHLYLYDIPGERFADAVLLENDYDVWSDAMVGRIKMGHYKAGGDQLGLSFVDDYAKLMDSDIVPGFEQIIHAYKLAMGEMTGRLYHDVCPSLFTLDRYGSNVKDEMLALYRGGKTLQDAIRQLAPKRQSGFPNGEFAPLSKKIRDNDPELAKTMANHYGNYVKSQQTLFDILRGCDGLIVLVDLADILQKGSDQLRETYEFIDNMLKVLDPRWNILRSAGSALGAVRAISNVAVVASQADRFHKDDESILQHLVEQLIHHPLSQISGIGHGSFVCSAIRSTEKVDDNNMKGILKAKGALETFPISRLPTNWDTCTEFPHEWDLTQFADIPRTFPPIPKLPTIPPPQTGLNEIFRFVTGW